MTTEPTGEFKMQEIKTIQADSDSKDEVYRLLNMVHSMAGSCAVAKIDRWELKSTASFCDYMMTTWTNGIVDLVAESRGDHHTYKLEACKNDEQ